MDKLTYINDMGYSVEFSITSPFILQKTEGLDMVENEIHSTKSINQDGVDVIGSSLNARNITIEGTIIKDAKSNRVKIIRIVNPKLKGKLIYENDDMKKYIECEVEQIPTISRKSYPEFFISLLCPDPFWKEIEEESKDLVTWIPNLEFPEGESFWTEQTPNYWIETEFTSLGFEEFLSEFGTGEGIEFGYRETNQIVEIDNIGDVKTPVRIVFRADADVVKPYIQDMNSYELIRVNKTLKAGDVLEIITEYGNKNIYLNGEKAHQYLDFINSTWLQLNSGINLIKYGAESGINNLECRVFYTPKYLGV